LDIVKELAELAVATRLKRLSELFSKGVGQLYHDLDLEFETRWFVLTMALSRVGRMSITELADSTGLSHTAVNQLASEMIAARLMISSRDKTDERRRLLQLSQKGRETVAALEPVWQAIRACAIEVLEAAGSDFLVAIESLERQLAERDMYDRVCARLGIKPERKLEIVDYRPAYKKHFRALNLDWLAEYFTVEKADEVLLADPNGRIIRKGGAVLFALLNGEVVGTAALLKLGDRLFELTKMAVKREQRGMGIGMALAEAVIERARSLGAREIVLRTSEELTAAMSLYDKLGFRRTDMEIPDGVHFGRKHLVMKLEL
jgi:ribosomal protein S18 acetylase RimI-like enzyme